VGIRYTFLLQKFLLYGTTHWFCYQLYFVYTVQLIQSDPGSFSLHNRYSIKEYELGIRIRPNVLHTTQNAFFKNYLKDSLRSLQNTISPSNIKKVFKRRTHFQTAGYKKIVKPQNLDLHACFPITVTSISGPLWPQFYATTTSSPVGCTFWGSNKCGASASFIFNQILRFKVLITAHCDC